MTRYFRFAPAAWLVLVLAAAPAAARDQRIAKHITQWYPDCYERVPRFQMPLDPNERAGYPRSICPRAVPSNTPHYFGYYVGGGSPRRQGDWRYRNEGTWGWDYGGILFTKRVNLKWWHGRRYQDGGGRYKTDGPKVIEHK